MADIEWPAGVRPRAAEFWLSDNVSRSVATFTRQERFLERPGVRWVARLTVVRSNTRSARAFDAFLSSLRGGLATVLVPEFRRQAPASPGYRSLADYAAGIDDIAFDDGSYLDDTTEAAGGILTEAGGSLAAEDGAALQDEVPPGQVGDLLSEDGSRLVIEASAAVAWAIEAEAPSDVWSWESDETPMLAGGAGSVLAVSGLAPETAVLLAGDMIQGSPGRAYEVQEDVITDAAGRAAFAVRPAVRELVEPGPLVTAVSVRMRLADDAQARNPTRAPVVSTYNLELVEDLTIG